MTECLWVQGEHLARLQRVWKVAVASAVSHAAISTATWFPGMLKERLLVVAARAVGRREVAGCG